MITGFKNKTLERCFYQEKCAKVPSTLLQRILDLLDAMDAATSLADLKAIPGGNFHPLKGNRKGAYTLHVNGPWCLTFKFKNGECFKVDLEQYH